MDIRNETRVAIYTKFDGDRVQIEIPAHNKPIIVDVPKTCIGEITIKEAKQ